MKSRIIVDARNKECPTPVVMTSRELEKSDEVLVIVNNEAAIENVGRLARSKGFSVEVESKEDGTYLLLKRESDRREDEKILSRQGNNQVIFVTSDSLGNAPAELGERLMRGFFHALLESQVKPEKIIFMAGGVKLVTGDSKLLEDLKSIASKGTEILACGTCLEYFGLTNKLEVGRISNMYEIVESLMGCEKIVRL
jgi:selenium metabolism protein YedF